MTEPPEATANPDEARLVLRSQAGDRAAFERLVRLTARAVYARLYLETGKADRAEDLTQETFLVAWRSIGQVTDPYTFRGWLQSISRNVLIDAARHDARKKRNVGGTQVGVDALGAVPDRGPGPAEALAREEDRQRVLVLLRSLPEEYRLPLMLRYLNGSDYDAISHQLGLTNGSLRGLLNRGMAALRDKARVAGLGWEEG